MTLPQVSFSLAMVEPVGGMVNPAPRALMRS
jgi:hypothetical protein